MKSLQETYAPNSICFGCGPANKQGLRIRSFANESSEVTATFTPESYHEAFPGMLNGGIIGSLLDCHSNWTAAWTLMNKQNLDQPPCTVTANYSVKLLRPTPSGQPVELVAKAIDVQEDRVTVEAVLRAGGKDCATCKGLFVAVKPGHPAYHRWS